MAETQTGIAAVWGADNFRVVASGLVLGLGDASPQNWNGDRTSDVANFMNGLGETIGRAFYSAKKTISISVMPVDSQTQTAAGAVASMVALLPAPATKVTLVDTDVVEDPSVATVWETLHSAAWYVNSSSMRLTNTGAAIIDLTLTQYDTAANDLATPTTN